MMTPQEVANCTFAKAAIGGYHMTSVDEFLDRLTEDYTALYKENAALKAKLKTTVDKIAEYREMEEAMRSTLLTAQKMATAMVAEAEQKRNAMIATASADAQARRNELAKQVDSEEQRLVEIRQRVDRELEMERKRLSAGKEHLKEFIKEMSQICNEHLAMLERLPDWNPDGEQPLREEIAGLPEQVPLRPAKPSVRIQFPVPVSAPTPAQEPLKAPAPAPAPVNAPQEEPPVVVAAAFAPQPGKPSGPPEGDPFEKAPSDSQEDMAETKIIDPLEFGANYRAERKGKGKGRN